MDRKKLSKAFQISDEEAELMVEQEFWNMKKTNHPHIIKLLGRNSMSFAQIATGPSSAGEWWILGSLAKRRGTIGAWALKEPGWFLMGNPLRGFGSELEANPLKRNPQKMVHRRQSLRFGTWNLWLTCPV